MTPVISSLRRVASKHNLVCKRNIYELLQKVSVDGKLFRAPYGLVPYVAPTSSQHAYMARTVSKLFSSSLPVMLLQQWESESDLKLTLPMEQALWRGHHRVSSTAGIDGASVACKAPEHSGPGWAVPL